MKYKFIKMEDALETLIDYRGKTPKKSNEGIITLSAKSVKNNYIDYSQCYFISEKRLKDKNVYTLMEGESLKSNSKIKLHLTYE